MITKEQILEYWFEEYEKYINQYGSVNLEDLCKKVYFKMTKKYGREYEISSDGVGSIIYSYEGYKSTNKNNKQYEAKIKEIREILEKENPIIILDCRQYNLLYFFENAIITLYVYNEAVDSINVYTNDEEIANEWYKKISWKECSRYKNTYYYASFSDSIIKNTSLEFKKFETNIDKNYNDDLPLDNIINFLKDDCSGLILLHGEPGTGKTSFLKHLISTEISKKFIVIPKEIFNAAGQTEFLNYFLNNKDSIFILEDCEKVLMKREKGASLETILNMSDGLLGSSLNTKFICTFNTDLGNIDKALLRKGRLRIKYEFKKLTLEKIKLHLPEATKEMTLAEIYNPEDNGVERDKRKRIGY